MAGRISSDEARVADAWYPCRALHFPLHRALVWRGAYIEFGADPDAVSSQVPYALKTLEYPDLVVSDGRLIVNRFD